MRDYLKELRYNKGFTLREVEEKTGISHSHISFLESGKKNLNERLIKLLSECYGVSYSEILGEKIEHTQPIKGAMRILPVIGSVEAGNWSEVIDTLPDDHNDFVLVDTTDHKNSLALRVQGLSMSPKFNDGDVILVNTDNTTPQSGDYVVAMYNDEATFKQYISEAGTVQLMPLNPMYSPLKVAGDIKVIGTVWGKTTLIEKI